MTKNPSTPDDTKSASATQASDRARRWRRWDELRALAASNTGQKEHSDTQTAAPEYAETAS